MGEVVSLNQYRKKHERAAHARTAAENRASHGLSKEQRHLLHKTKTKGTADLDGKRLEPDPPEDPPRAG